MQVLIFCQRAMGLVCFAKGCARHTTETRQRNFRNTKKLNRERGSSRPKVSLLISNGFKFNQLLERGGYPLSVLGASDDISVAWRKGYIKTFLERDIPELGINIPAEQLRRFWMMLAHYHGNTFNASELGRSMGVSHKTMKEYVDILTGTFMVRQLQPWYENIGKR